MAEDEAGLMQHLFATVGPALPCARMVSLTYGESREYMTVQAQWCADGRASDRGEAVPSAIFAGYLGQPYVECAHDALPLWPAPAPPLRETLTGPGRSLAIPYGDPQDPEGYLAILRNPGGSPYTAAEIDVGADLASAIRLRRGQLRRQAESREQHERLECALLSTDLGVWDWELQSGAMRINQRWSEMLGYRSSDLAPHIRSWEQLLHPADAPTVRTVLAAYLEERTLRYQSEYRLRAHTGEWKWVLATGRVVARDAQGNPTRMAGTHQDITNWKATAQLLQLQRDLTLALGATSDIHEAFQQVLSTACRIEGIDCGGGYLMDQATSTLHLVAHQGLSVPFINHASSYPADSPETRLVMAGQPMYKPYAAVAQPDPYKEQEGLRALAVLPVAYNGQMIAVLNLASHTQDTMGASTRAALEVIAAQIGGALARIQAEAARQESLQNLQTLFDTVNDFLFILDAQGKIVNVNPAARQRLGYSQEQLLQMHVLEVHPPERREEAGKIVAAMLAGECSVCPVPLITSTGQLIPVETKVVKGQWSGQEGLFGLSRDITERLQAEAILREREQLLNALFKQALDGCFFMMLDAPVRWDATVSKEAVLDYVFAHQRLTRVNGAMLEQYRATEAQLLGKTPGDFFAHQLARGRASWRQFFDAGRLHIETDERALDGVPMWIEGDYVCLYDSEGRITGHFGIQRDVTQRKNAAIALQESYRQLEITLTELRAAQEQLLQQERLAAVGQLAAGIAHDFNNILTSILGYTELLQLAPETPPSIQADLQSINAASQRAAHLVRQLLDFSRKTIRHLRPLQLDAFATETVTFFQRVLPESIQLRLTIPPDDYLIEADPTQMQQLITNLAVNARDAMPMGGVLHIRLARVVFAAGTSCGTCQCPINGTWVQFQMSDTGSGIAAAILPRIFEPFFTTKAVGKGVGLGLAQVYGIVQQQRGHITVESRVGHGSTFTIYLPPSAAPAPPGEGDPVPIRRGRGETILLVEDEPTVLEVTRSMLTQLGYHVYVAANGREAVTQFEAHQEQVDLVVSDMVMPDMDGAALFHQLKAKIPAVKMVIMSGYPLGEQGATLLEQGVVAWVAKPLSLGQLSQVVGKGLSSHKGHWG